MIDLSNYYQRDPRDIDSTLSERFPNIHVKFSAILKPIEWVYSVYGLFGSQAFKLKKELLKEFDSVAPLDEYMGTEEELNQIRALLISTCEGIDNNPFISPIGRFLIKKMGLNAIKTRKKVLQYYHSNKKFIETNGKFKAPVIITGVPRSGTTLLQRLMSEDPNTRAPYTFEMEVPIPPMGSEADPLRDPRIKKAGIAISTISRLAPGFMEKLAESHLWSATEMEESFLYMLTHNGVNLMFNATAGKAYIDDFFRIDAMRPLLRYERMFFTMLDAYRPAKSHWTLKAPLYASCFPAFFQEYPDARVVLTHRNPLVTFPSIIRLMESWSIAFDKDGSFDKHRFGYFQKKFMENFLLLPFNYRKKHQENEEQIFDCLYDELFSDPIAMVKRIYHKFELEYTKKFEKKMKNYLQNNKQGKYGRHKYSLEEYGLHGDGLYQKYKNYMDHYNFRIPDKIERPIFFDFAL